MSEPIDHDLERRVRELELAISGTAPAHLPRRRSPIRRVLVSIATVIALAALPMMAVASDVFRDVDDTSPFHDAINELYGARITRGCATNPLRYCPDQALTRGQMAGMLTRSLGRVVYDRDADTTTNSVASVTVDAGGLPGGTGYVLINATVSASTELGADEEAPASMILFAVERSAAPYSQHEADEVGWDAAFNLFGPAAPPFELDPNAPWVARASGSMSEVFVVPSGESRTFDLVVHAEHTDPTSSVEVTGHMTALYVPFGEPGPFTP